MPPINAPTPIALLRRISSQALGAALAFALVTSGVRPAFGQVDDPAAQHDIAADPEPEGEYDPGEIGEQESADDDDSEASADGEVIEEIRV
ncbi:MAG: hypothetical protein JRG92_22120, partial [Deltaproteobacteria bacterium]|nr:hypothetical protein [Deltaproteobacteria bacterium]